MKTNLAIIAFILAVLSWVALTPTKEPAALGGPIEEAKERTVKEQVAGKPALERASIKGDAILAKTEWISYAEGDLTIEIQSVEKIEGGVQVFARAWKDGQPLGFSDGSVEIERFRFLNPPVMVPDGTCTDVSETLGSKQITTCQPNYREDPERALQMALAHTISVSGKDGKNIVPGKRGNTTSTFYPDANVESTSVDGYVGHDAAADTWANRRSAAGNTSSDSSTLGIASVQYSTSGWGSIYRFVMLFDTSSIADTDVVSSATLSLYGRSGADQSCATAVNTNMNFGSSNPASNTALANSDYDVTDFGSTAFLDTSFTYASFSTSAYNDGTLNASGIANISVSSVSKFAARNYGDLANSEPTCSGTQAAEFRFESADQTGTTNDPKLVVTHAAGASDNSSLILRSGDIMIRSKAVHIR